jgi:hypothetical protein
MEFEHLVQVNDLNRPDIASLSRGQLWQGLLARAHEPDQFVVGLEQFELLEVREDYLMRRLHLPGLTIEDEVWLSHQDQVHYRIRPSADTPGGTLTMRIEEPSPGALFVRFSYYTEHHVESDDGIPYDEFVRQAYIAADVDTIRLIRERFSS